MIFSKKTPLYGYESARGDRNSSDERLKFYFYNLAARLPISLQKFFFYWEIIRNAIDPKSKSIVDVGCGKGTFMSYLKKFKNKYYSIGIDAWEPYIKFCLSRKIHDKVYTYDMRNLSNPKIKADTVLCLEVIEHLSKRDGLSLIKNLENLALRQVIISTPVGFHIIEMYDGTPYQVHRSGWNPHEFKKQGYTVRGTTGLRWLRGERAGSLFQNPIFKVFNVTLSYLSQPLTYFVPELAWGMVCIKILKKIEAPLV